MVEASELSYVEFVKGSHTDSYIGEEITALYITLEETLMDFSQFDRGAQIVVQIPQN